MSCTTYGIGTHVTMHQDRRLSFRPLRPIRVPCQSQKKIIKEIEKSKQKVVNSDHEIENCIQCSTGDIDILCEIIKKDYETKRYSESRGFCCHCGNKYGGEYDVTVHLAKNKFCGSWNNTIYKYIMNDTKIKIYASFLYDCTCDNCGGEFNSLEDLEKHKALTPCGQKTPELIMKRDLHLSLYTKPCSYFSSYKFHFYKKYRLD